MQFLPVLSFIFLFALQGITQTSCLASAHKDEAYSAEPAKKRQRTLPSSPKEPLLEVPECTTFPDEVWLHIFDALSFQDLRTVKRVCKAWSHLAQDEWLSLPKQIHTKPLVILWKKLEDSKTGQEGLFHQFFASPLALEKICADPFVLKEVLGTSSLLPLFFKSKITAARIHEAFAQEKLENDPQTALEAYARTTPIFPFEKSLFSQEFIEFTQTHAAPYKALYLLKLFNLPSSEPITALFRRVNQEVILEDIYTERSEGEAILLPQAMTSFPNMPRAKAYNMAEYCHLWADQKAKSLFRDKWLRLAEVFYREAARQGDTDAQLDLSVILEHQDKFVEAREVLSYLAHLGDAEGQCTLALHHEVEGQMEQAEFYYRQAANQGHTEAQLNLGRLLEHQGNCEEAEGYYRHAAEQGCVPAQNSLGFCLEKKGDFQGAFLNYEKAARRNHGFACLNLAYLLEQHPELFNGSEEERMQEIDHLRDTGKEMYNPWSQARRLNLSL